VTIREKITLVLEIVHRFGAHSATPVYDARFDLNADGVIDVHDLLIVVHTPHCGPVNGNR
jgi:hypothetical protein